MRFLEALIDPQRQSWPALRTASVWLDYGGLASVVTALAGRLAAEGIGLGERVLVICPNGAEHLVAVLAVLWQGAVAVPLDPGVGEYRLRAVVADVGAAVTLTDTVTSLPGEIADVLRFRIEDGRVLFSEGETASTALQAAPALVSPQTFAFVRYSSGSTGRPKGVVLDHAHLDWMARALAARFGLDRSHRELVLTPMAYSGGWQRVATTLYVGGCVFVPDGPLSVPAMVEDIARWRITGFFTPPPLIRALLTLEGDALSVALDSCRCVEIGSAALGAEMLAAWLARTRIDRVWIHYGLTECSRATLLDARRHPSRLDSVGRPLPGVEVRIVDGAGRRLEAGETGEIQVRGPQQGRGYWRGDGLSPLASAGGWIATGDEGVLDRDGFLVWRGRRDERINCGGHSFFPAEVEAALGPVPGVREYLVAGMPDPRGMLGEVPWAFVVPLGEAAEAVRAFSRLARHRLPAHQVPRWLVPVAEIPKTASGKLDRRRTVARYGRQGNRHGQT